MKTVCLSEGLMNQRWLSRKEAAAYLRICEVLLDKLIKSGRLPAGKIGRRVIIDRLEIDRRVACGGL